MPKVKRSTKQAGAKAPPVADMTSREIIDEQIQRLRDMQAAAMLVERGLVVEASREIQELISLRAHYAS